MRLRWLAGSDKVSVRKTLNRRLNATFFFHTKSHGNTLENIFAPLLINALLVMTLKSELKVIQTSRRMETVARLTRLEGRGHKKFPKGPPSAYVFWKKFQKGPPFAYVLWKNFKGSPLCLRFLKKFQKNYQRGEYWLFLPHPVKCATAWRKCSSVVTSSMEDLEWRNIFCHAWRLSVRTQATPCPIKRVFNEHRTIISTSRLEIKPLRDHYR